MESEWQVSVGRTKKKRHVVEEKVTTPTYITIEPEVFLQYKSMYTTVSFDLSKKFDHINKMFSTSTQYLDSKERINHNQHNHNKWQNKKSSECDDIYMILGNFNKLTIQNFDKIVLEIKKYNIITYEEMTRIVESIYTKCVNDIQFVNVYAKLIKVIAMECKWVVYDNNSKPITFRKYFINYLESNFSQIINDIKTYVEDDENDSLAKQMQIRKTYIELLCVLFNESVIGNQLFRYIFTNIESAYIESSQEEFMNRWLQMYESAEKVWNGSNKKYLDEKRQFITNHYDDFSVRIKILTENIKLNDDTKESNETKTNENTNVFVFNRSTKEKVEEKKEEITETDDYDYELLILSCQDYDNLDEWYEAICGLDGINIINKLLSHLVKKVTDLKITFKILAYMMNVNNDYNKFIVEHITNNIDTVENKSYVANVKKLLK